MYREGGMRHQWRLRRARRGQAKAGWLGERQEQDSHCGAPLSLQHKRLHLAPRWLLAIPSGAWLSGESAILQHPVATWAWAGSGPRGNSRGMILNLPHFSGASDAALTSTPGKGPA